MNSNSLALVKMALEEDLQDVGDLTSLNFVDENHESVGRIVSREEAVISGLEVAEKVCCEVDGDLRFVALVDNGQGVRRGDIVCELIGKTRSILTAERTVLNFLQRLSGVATVTKTFVDSIEGTGAVLLDTRKTTPGWRALEKKAVAHGGATNHRAGLYDVVMVKDNHLAANLTPINLAEHLAAFKSDHSGLKIEVEADRLDQVEAFLKIDGIDVILLDNMSNHQLASAVKMRDKLGVKTKLEASGGVTLKSVRGIAETGVEFISVGALTHSVRSIDLGLDLFS